MVDPTDNGLAPPDRAVGPPVVCVGGANIDRKVRLLRPLALRSSNPVDQSETLGGVARNVAENLARLKLPVALMAAVGDDALGQTLLQAARQVGIDTTACLRVPGVGSGQYTAVLDADGEMVLGTAYMVACDALDTGHLQRHHELIAHAPLLMADLNLARYVLAALQAQRLSRASPEGRSGLMVWAAVSEPKMAALPARLDGVDVLVLNQGELAAVSDAGDTAGPANPALSALTVPWDIAAQGLFVRGLRCLVVTAGAQGVSWVEAHPSGLAWRHFDAPAVPVCEVTGAGDAFTAGLCLGLARTDAATPWTERMDRACALGLALAALTLQTADTVRADLSVALLDRQSALIPPRSA